jgi:predicted alpha/beta-fold hydrolase
MSFLINPLSTLQNLISSIGFNTEFIKNISKFAILSVFYYLLAKQLPFFNKTKLLYKITEKNLSIIKNFKNLNYRPTFYLPSFTLQLICHEIYPASHVKFIRDYVNAKDGGVISMDWVINKNMEKNFDKVLVVLHGLTGGSETNYIRDIIVGFEKAGGYKIVIIHNRGINDTPLLTPFSFHAAFTDDLKMALSIVKQRYGGYPCYGLAVSMGANIFTKLLAHDHSFDSYIKGFVSVSNPLNLHESEKLTRNTYLGFFLYRALKKYLEQHSMLRSNQDLQFEMLNELKTCRDFDSNFTCKLHGFRNVDEYYLSTSSGPDISKINVPCMFINAKDDLLAPVYSIDLKPCK